MSSSMAYGANFHGQHQPTHRGVGPAAGGMGFGPIMQPQQATPQQWQDRVAQLGAALHQAEQRKNAAEAEASRSWELLEERTKELDTAKEREVKHKLMIKTLEKLVKDLSGGVTSEVTKQFTELALAAKGRERSNSNPYEGLQATSIPYGSRAEMNTSSTSLGRLAAIPEVRPKELASINSSSQISTPQKSETKSDAPSSPRKSNRKAKKSSNSEGKKKEESSELVNTKAQGSSFDFEQAYMRYFHKVMVFCANHTSPTGPEEKHMTPELREFFGSVCTRPQLVKYLTELESRPMLLARYIMEQTTNKVWKLSLVRDFNQDQDLLDTIAKCREMLRGNPADSEKAAIFTLQAETVETMIRHPSFKAYLHFKASQTFTPILKAISFFCGPLTGNAFKDLRWLWSIAHEIGAKMHGNTCTYRFDYIRPDKNSYFNPSTMTSVDKLIEEDDVQVRKSDRRVYVCVTPVVVMTQQVAASISPKTIAKARVLVH